MINFRQNQGLILLVSTLALLLSGCICGSPSASSYPAEVTGIGESENFPTQAAGYSRGKTLTYEPGMTNFSIAYAREEPDLNNSATIYFYGDGQNLDDQFESEMGSIREYHRQAQLIDFGATQFEKDGISYDARYATFELEMAVRGQTELVFSELIVISHPERFIKIRSTAPFHQKDLARTKLRALLDVVQWAH